VSATRAAEIDVLCLLAGTPAVLTELLFGLSVLESNRVGRVTIVTTEGMIGRLSAVISPAGDAGPQLEALHERWPQTRPLEPMSPPVLIKTADAADADANRLAGREIDGALVSALRERPLVACISGGRKSMTAWLTIATTLRAREHDRLVHVTVPFELETKDFFFPTALRDKKKVRLADVPFPRLEPLTRRHRAATIDAAVAEVTADVRAFGRPRLRVPEDRPGIIVFDGREHELASQAWALLRVYVEAASAGAAEVRWGSDASRKQRFHELWSLARERAPAQHRGGKVGRLGDDEDEAAFLYRAHTRLRDRLGAICPALARAWPEADRAQQQRAYRIPQALRPFLD
jgi:CRISPR-associated protein (TIGR02584 family)